MSTKILKSEPRLRLFLKCQCKLAFIGLGFFQDKFYEADPWRVNARITKTPALAGDTEQIGGTASPDCIRQHGGRAQPDRRALRQAAIPSFALLAG